VIDLKHLKTVQFLGIGIEFGGRYLFLVKLSEEYEK